MPARLGAAPRGLASPPKVADPFYLSPGWRRFAEAIKSQRGWVCEACGFDGSQGRSRRLMHADHVEERKDGGADFDPGNIRVLCQRCHNRKTAGAAKRRGV